GRVRRDVGAADLWRLRVAEEVDHLGASLAHQVHGVEHARGGAGGVVVEPPHRPQVGGEVEGGAGAPLVERIGGGGGEAGVAAPPPAANEEKRPEKAETGPAALRSAAGGGGGLIPPVKLRLGWPVAVVQW